MAEKRHQNTDVSPVYFLMSLSLFIRLGTEAAGLLGFGKMFY
jgi:hypothetical protein